MLFWNLLLSLCSMNEAYVHNKLLYLKIFTNYISKTQILRAVVLEVLSLNQQHQYHIELVRNSSQTWGSLVTQMVAFVCNAGDQGLIAGLGRSSGEGNDNQFQYSCLKNSKDRGAWRLQSMGSHGVKHNTHAHTHISDLLDLKQISKLSWCTLKCEKCFFGYKPDIRKDCSTSKDGIFVH